MIVKGAWPRKPRLPRAFYPTLQGMNARRLAGVFVVCSLTVACSGSEAPPAQSADLAPALSPLLAARPYQVELPDSDARPAPLVVVLHGFTANGLVQDAYFGMSRFGRSRGIITAFPDGTKNSMGQRFWNATDGCCDFDRSGVDDVAYLTAVIDDAIARHGADPRRVYLLGHSNGGFMSYRMACDRSDRIAAFASLAGANWKDTSKCKPGTEVAALQIHGTMDDSVPYQGSTMTASANESVAFFAKADGCADKPESGAARDLDSRLMGSESMVLRWPGCRKGAAELWTIAGGAHLPNLSANFAEQVYGFLSQHQR